VALWGQLLKCGRHVGKATEFDALRLAEQSLGTDAGIQAQRRELVELMRKKLQREPGAAVPAPR